MKTIEIFHAKLAKMPKLRQPLKKFLLDLVAVFLLCPGRYNFMNLSRWSSYSDRSIRRHYDKEFAFVEINKQLIDDHFGNAMVRTVLVKKKVLLKFVLRT